MRFDNLGNAPSAPTADLVEGHALAARGALAPCFPLLSSAISTVPLGNRFTPLSSMPPPSFASSYAPSYAPSYTSSIA